MKSKHFLGFLVAGVSIAANAGCSSGDGTGSGGSDATSTSVSSSSVSSSSVTGVSVSVSSSSSGAPPDTNVSCMTGKDLVLGTAESATLDPADADEDFYKFTGVKGEPFLIFADAKPTGAEFDPSYLDVVVTLYDANGIQVAENDDPFPRFSNDSELYTMLPEDGTYCVRVTECSVLFGAASCAPVSGIVDLSYRLNVIKVDPMLASVVAEIEPNDTAAMGTVMEYSKNMAGNYFVSLAYGLFDTPTDVDVYPFTEPPLRRFK